MALSRSSRAQNIWPTSTTKKKNSQPWRLNRARDSILMIQPGEHVTIFGITGSGKTTLTRKIAALFPRRIVFDRLNDHAGGGVEVRDFQSFARVYKENFEHDDFAIVVRPPAGISSEELQELADSILQLTYSVESHTQKGIGVIFEEVWLYAPLHFMPHWFQETLLTGRHYRISLVANSQRPAHVNKALISQSRHVFVGQFFESRDRKYFEESFGRIPEIEQSPARYHFWWFRTDQKPLMITTG